MKPEPHPDPLAAYPLSLRTTAAALWGIGLPRPVSPTQPGTPDRLPRAGRAR